MGFQIPSVSLAFYVASAPIILLCAMAMVALLLAVKKSIVSIETMFAICVGTLVLCLATALSNFIGGGSGVQTYLAGGFLGGHLGDFGQALILSVALVVSLLTNATYMRQKFFRGEIVALFFMVLAGMLAMVSTDDLVTLFVGLEMASIGMYALIGYTHPNRLSQEGAIKYFVLGSIAAAILLMGFGFLFAATGSLRISEISAGIVKVSAHPWVELGTILTVAGIGFKMALVPFHMWTPDAYESAPTGLTAFMATAMKAMIVVTAVRLFQGGLAQVHGVWVPTICFLAALSLIFGNVMALAQQSVKRLLAYSSISHSGYMALSIAAMSGTTQTYPVPSIIFYLMAYVIVSLGAFAVVMWLENERCENIILDDLTGLSKKHPWAAVALAIFMFSLGGMPPTIGFISKLYVFNAALSNGITATVVVAAIGSTIALYYYLRIIVRMFMMEANPALEGLIRPSHSTVITAIVAIAVTLVLAFGTVAPEPILKLARFSATEITGG